MLDILDQLEHFILNDPSEDERLSSLVPNLVSDIGVFAKARDELDSLQPWAAGMDYEFSKVQKELEQTVSKQFNVRQAIDNNMKLVSTGLASLGCPIYLGEIRFHYPSDKRRTKETTEAMQLAEKNLDQFWAKFDAKYKSKFGKPMSEIVEGFSFETRDLEQTSNWLESAAKSNLIGKSINEIMECVSFETRDPEQTSNCL